MMTGMSDTTQRDRARIEREKRLAENLRANLQRRKAVARQGAATRAPERPSGNTDKAKPPEG